MSASPSRPPCQTGPTVWITQRAGRRYPAVALASPGRHPSRPRHSASSSGPAARWMAPSTPPPPRRDSLAALTMASTSSCVMSPSMTSRRAMMLPVADRTGVEMDEAGARVEADAAHLQRARGLAHLEHRHAWEADVHRVAVHVLAVARHAAADAGEPRVGLGRTEG